MKRLFSTHHLNFFKLNHPDILKGLGAHVHAGKVFLYFLKKEGNKYSLSRAESSDGLGFSLDSNEPHLYLDPEHDFATVRDFDISDHHGLFVMGFRTSTTERRYLGEAWSTDLKHWMQKYQTTELPESCHIVSNYMHKGRYVMYGGKGAISAYTSKDLKDWTEKRIVLEPRETSFDSGSLSVELAMKTPSGILVIYTIAAEGNHTVGVALFDLDDPCRLLWRGNAPIWHTPPRWRERARHFGTVILAGRLISYWHVKDDGYWAVVYGLYKTADGHLSKDISLSLKRVEANPILAPNPGNSWEAFNTFNPAAVYADGKVHLLYRAQGYDYISVVGYASSKNGIKVTERLEEPAYLPSASFEYTGTNKPEKIAHMYVSGGGFGGVEDPRATIIGNRLYMTYVAFDGVSPPRIALTSIPMKHFLNKRWLWEKPVLISPPGIVDKSAVIFPEKVHGKYVIMHRIYPNILIDFVDSLDFDGKHWLKGQYKIPPRPDHWDSRKIGAGAPPIKTPFGWLLIYQSVGEQDSGRYKIGAMLLDLDDPTIVLARSQSPILEPDATYENEGFKAGVIYPCGAVVIKDTLYVYYGGADSYVCVATAKLDEFLRELRHSEVARLTQPQMQKLM